MSTHPDHNPWNGVSEDSFLYHIKAIERLAVRLDKVNHDTAITRPQDTGRNFHHSREVGRIANRSDTPWTVSHLRPEVLRSLEGARQRLKFLRDMFVSEALHVHRAVEVRASRRFRYLLRQCLLHV